jgi:hypothetical protein
MKVVAFDPGWQEIAVSEWSRGRLESHRMVPRMKDYGVYLGELGELAKWADAFVIEDQHAGLAGIIHSNLPKFKKSMLIGARVNSIIKISKVAAEILIYGVQNDVEIHEVMASSWQAMFTDKAILGAFELPPLPKRKTKEASKLVAKRIAKEVIKNHNVADAICLGYKWHYDQGLILLG